MKSSKRTRILLSVLAVALAVIVIAISGTISYLKDVSDAKVNEFDPSKVTVDVEETPNQYKIIPGTEQTKDPKAVIDNDIDAYLFVEVVDETEGKVTYEIADGWTLLNGYDNIYYRTVGANDPKEYPILKNNKVSYSAALEESDMPDGKVKLSFIAKAIQKDAFADEQEAYANIPTTLTNGKDMKNALDAGVQSVVLTADDEDAPGVVVKQGDTATVDLNGNDYLVSNNLAGSAGTQTQCFQFLPGATVTLKDGTIGIGEDASDSILIMIQNYADLTLENVNIDGVTNGNRMANGYAVSSNYGSVTIKGNTNITVPAGAVALDIMDWTNSDYLDQGSVCIIDESMTGTIDGIINVYQWPDMPEANTKAELIIKGGTFKNTGLTLEKFKEYVADGYKVNENTDGSWTVVKA